MGEASVRDLRNHGGEVLDRVAAGERVTITRDGTPVAELTPLPRRRVNARGWIEQLKRLPPVDARRFRADIDSAVGQTL